METQKKVYSGWNPDSWHAKLYQMNFKRYYGELLPTNFCDYWWRVIRAIAWDILIFPFSIPLIIIAWFSSTFRGDLKLCGSGFGTVALVYYLVAIPATIATYQGNILISIFKTVSVSYLIVIMCIAVAFVASLFKEGIDRYNRNKKPRVPRVKKPKKIKGPGFFKTKIKSFKEKNCPIIEWDYSGK